MRTYPPTYQVLPSNELVIAPIVADEVYDDKLLAKLPVKAEHTGPNIRIIWTIAAVVGILTGYTLYLIRLHLAAHDQQLSQQGKHIERLAAAQNGISGERGALRMLMDRVGGTESSLRDQQARQKQIEKRQEKLQNREQHDIARLQKQIDELLTREAAVNTAQAKIEKPGTQETLPSHLSKGPVMAAHEHGTFNMHLKPSSNSYMETQPNGLTVWMTPKPGAEGSVPVSGIGKVRGLGTLVHCWSDGKDYFITESGGWITDQQ